MSPLHDTKSDLWTKS